MSNKLSLQQFLPYRCNSLAKNISESLSRIYVDRFGITVPEWRVLVTLAEHSELQSKQIGLHTNMDKVRVSRAVASLQGRGLLARRPCERDSRASLLSLNHDGHALYQRIEPEALAWEQALLAPLTGAEQQQLFGLIDKLDGRLAELAGCQ